MRGPTWHETVATRGWSYRKRQPSAGVFCTLVGHATLTVMNRKPLFFALILAALLLALHLHALDGFLYWYYRWLDIPMHILGGAALGAFLLAFFNVRHALAYFFLMFVLVIGWEVFEFIGRISTGQADYWSDTLFDVGNGILGSLLPYLVARFSLWRSN
jgi:hypothetical protein